MQRSGTNSYFPFVAAWNGAISISFFYYSGLLNTIGTSSSIPYILAGLVCGSLLYPVLSAAWFNRSVYGVALSFLATLTLFTAVTLYIQDNAVLDNAQTLFLSFISPAGTLFSTSVYFHASGGRTGVLRPSIHVWLGGLFMAIILFSAYLITFYRYMPLIISASLVVCGLLLTAGFLRDRTGRENIV